MKEDTILSIQKVVMYVWLSLGILGLIACAVVYFNYSKEDLRTVALVTFISFMMYGWKRFQISKFSPGPKNES